MFGIAVCCLGCLALASVNCAAPPPPGEPAGSGLCPDGQSPWLVFALDEGRIEAELFETAAPLAVRTIAGLATDGHYDGQTFGYTKPHIEIVTSAEAEETPLLLENEIDAGALGLDEERIDSIDRAVDTFQLEIFPAYTKNKKQPATARLEEWLETWKATQSADFLVGVSRREINEALGYVYTTGFDSRPVTKGALMLEAASPTQSTARLSIALYDHPERTGRTVVIGLIKEGIELADDISIRPLDVPPGQRSYDFRPREPVVINTVRFECRAP